MRSMKTSSRKGNLRITGDRRELGNTPRGKMRGTIDSAYHTAISDDNTISTMESIEAVTLGQNTTLSVIVKNPCAKLN